MLSNLTLQTGDDYALVPEEAVWLANFPSPRTRMTYKNAVAEFINVHDLTTAEELYAVTPAHVVAWRDALTKQGASPRTIANRLSALSSLFKHLCDRQLAKDNPVAAIKRPKVASHHVETAALSRAQVRTLLDAPLAALETLGPRVNRDQARLQALRDRALMAVFFYTGCRVSEPAQLRVRDFHQDQGYMVLDFTVKGGKRNRVAIHPECQAALTDYLAEAGHGDERDAYLFQSVKSGRAVAGKPLLRQTIDAVFRKHAKAAGLPAGITPHSARATFITEALSHDHAAEAVQRTVGHASITTTLAYDKRDNHPRKSASFAVRY